MFDIDLSTPIKMRTKLSIPYDAGLGPLHVVPSYTGHIVLRSLPPQFTKHTFGELALHARSSVKINKAHTQKLSKQPRPKHPPCANHTSQAQQNKTKPHKKKQTHIHTRKSHTSSKLFKSHIGCPGTVIKFPPRGASSLSPPGGPHGRIPTRMARLASVNLDTMA